MRHVGDAVQPEGVARAYPRHVGLEHTHARVTHFFHNVALQQGADALFGMQVRLRPKSDFHTVRMGIVCQCSQVGDVAVQGFRLSVAGSVAVVRKQPAQRHVVVLVAVYHGARGELVVVLLAVQRLLDAAVVALALLVALAVLKRDAVLVLLPEVTVVGVQVSLVEAELRKQHRMARQLIEVVQQRHRAVVHRHEGIQVIGLMEQLHHALLLAAEVINTPLEGVPQDAVAVRGPIVRIGRSHTAIRPTVLVLDGNRLSLMGEASVLHAASVEVLLRMLLQLQGDPFFLKEGRLRLFQHDGARLQVGHFQQGCLLVHLHHHLAGRDGDTARPVVHLQHRQALARVVHQDFGFRLRLRVAEDAAVVVPEQTEDVVSIEVERHALPVGVQDFDSGRIDFHDTRHGGKLPRRRGGSLLAAHRLCRQIGSGEKHRASQRHGFPLPEITKHFFHYVDFKVRNYTCVS